MARITLTTTTQLVVQGAVDNDAHSVQVGNDFKTRSYLIWATAGTGTAMFDKGFAESDPAAFDMSQAARLDMSKAMLTYECEPGIGLFGKVSSGTLDLEILPGGER